MALSSELPGTWLLESRIDVLPNGVAHPDPLLGSDPVALLIYDRAGHFSAQFMKRVRLESAQTAAPNAKNNTEARDGYDAYFGTYTVDDANSTVTQRLMGSLSPSNVGMVLTREMHVSGDRLVISLDTTAADGSPVIRTLSWQRVSAL